MTDNRYGDESEVGCGSPHIIPNLLPSPGAHPSLDEWGNALSPTAALSFSLSHGESSTWEVQHGSLRDPLQDFTPLLLACWVILSDQKAPSMPWDTHPPGSLPPSLHQCQPRCCSVPLPPRDIFFMAPGTQAQAYFVIPLHL